MIFTEAKSKKEIAHMLGISPGTLRNWLNKRYIKELRALDYHPKQKLLTPKQLNFLVEKIDLSG